MLQIVTLGLCVTFWSSKTEFSDYTISDLIGKL